MIPPQANAQFVYHMEDVLELYHQPYDGRYPTVCFDETSKQLVRHSRVPWPTAPGQVARYDYQYARQGVRHLFMFFEPRRGWRQVEVTAHRTKVDWAHCRQQLADEFYPDAVRIRVIQDQLNTHDPAALYEVFEPEKARQLLNRLEFHYTPKHGSWLNMAEIEFSVLSRQCLDQRIPDEPALARGVGAWVEHRNLNETKLNWRFTTQDARIKLKKLYPSYHT